MKPATSRIHWLLYAAFILYGGAIPFEFAGDLEILARRWHSLPLSPFISPETGRRLSIPDVAQNLLWFVPFGVLGVMAAGDPRRWTWARIAWVTLLGAALSCVVETLQLLSYFRVASTADVMSNTAGSLVGAVGARWSRGIASSAMNRLGEEGLVDVVPLRLVIVAAGVLAVAYLQPFDVTLDVGGVVSHVRAFQADPWQFSTLRDEGLMVLLTTIFAMTLASYLSAIGEVNAGRKAALLGIIAVVGFESAQFFILSRQPSLWDVAIGIAGLFVGAALWTMSLRIDWPALWQGLLVTMTAGAAAIQMLSPFRIAHQYHGATWFSFLRDSVGPSRTPFETIGHVSEIALLFFPLGFCLGLAAQRRSAALARTAFATLLIAAPLEYTQGWIEGRYPEVTDIALALVGGLAGVLLSRPPEGRLPPPAMH